MLIVGRTIAGIGGSGVLNGGLVVLATVVSADKRARRSYLSLSSTSLLIPDSISWSYDGIYMGSYSAL
jgi:hypothetical protein